MKPFEMHIPESLDQVSTFLQDANAKVKPLSGGTALMMMMKSGIYEPEALISLRKVPSLHGISLDSNGTLHIQAMSTLNEIEHSPLILKNFSVISKTMKRLANIRVRNVACIGGAIAHGDPHMDIPPLMTALNATVNIVSRSGKRTLPIENFYLGYYTTRLNGSEIIESISIPSITNRHCLYLKCTTRSSDDWPTLGVALNIGLENNTIHSPQIILSAVVQTPTRLLNVETFLNGRILTPAILENAGEIASKSINPDNDTRGSSMYKKQLIKVYIKRAIQKCLSEKAQP